MKFLVILKKKIPDKQSNILNKCDFTKYVKMNKKPALTNKHKKIRIETILKWIRDDMNLKNIRFSDEKCFNFGGPDGFNYHWYNLRKQKTSDGVCVLKVDLLILWGVVSVNSKTVFVVLPIIMNIEEYQKS